MVAASDSSPVHRKTSWLPSLVALWSLSWRLSILLLFFVGMCFCVLVDRWWGAAGCILAFVIAAAIIRRVSTVEEETSSGDSIVFL